LERAEVNGPWRLPNYYIIIRRWKRTSTSPPTTSSLHQLHDLLEYWETAPLMRIASADGSIICVEESMGDFSELRDVRVAAQVDGYNQRHTKQHLVVCTMKEMT